MDRVLGEEWLSHSVDLLVRLVETAGALIIFVGAMAALVRFVVVGLRERRTRAFVPVRLGLGRFLALGLEFQLASDILRTAIAPTLREIAELAAVAAIRTALNFFLAREIRQERAELARDGRRVAPDPVDEPAGRAS
ncbi:hypothetical protein COO58_13815 [Micromonospora sp. WMMA1996]|uniref:DUF1622 domain-containing protein n=1 Tax=Micromonospora TaxID=1873 RepID=UPI000BF9D94E|nr:DUF1622 domain-containing protein [Micromonospora sp. WMMA1996]PGH45378.1 hypothetical protein COO58_13815 [Micromonospora sp. WMMA1996]